MKPRISLRARLRIAVAVGKAAKAAVLEFIDGIEDATAADSDAGARISRDEWKAVGMRVGEKVAEALVSSAREYVGTSDWKRR